MKIDAVIGAGYGDEGKGKTVDYLVSRSDMYTKPYGMSPLVVRCNSSAQAGHTVVINDPPLSYPGDIHDVRHVFSHFGSGTLRGAPTMLCHKFVVNPILFNKEWDQLVAQGIIPKVYVDPYCMMATPLDVLLNQLTELNRDLTSGHRHGSCGVGFGETIQRNTTIPSVPYNVGNTYLSETKKDLLLLHFYREFHKRNLKNDITFDIYDIVQDVLEGLFNWDALHEQHMLFVDRVQFQSSSYIKQFKHVIFEGAQGLGLDMDKGAFPYVTRCNTGLKDITDFLKENKIDVPIDKDPMDVYYVTRTYATRHGRGPLPGEYPTKPDYVVENTNVFNDFQEHFRYAPLQGHELLTRVNDDFNEFALTNSHRNLVINHCDQYTMENIFNPKVIQSRYRKVLLGYGPTALDFQTL